MRSFLARLAGILLIALSTPALFGQADSDIERRRRQYDEDLRWQMDRPASPEQRMGVDWGGWFNFAFAHFDDVEHKSSTFARYDLYLWGRAVVDYSHEFYARGRFSFVDYIHSVGPSERDHDWEGPAVDRLFYSYDLRAGALKRRKQVLPYNVFATIGRQYVQFGTGLALSLPLDAVVVGGELANTEIKALLGRSIESINNPIDHSPPVASHSERDFYGFQATYKGLKGHEPFAYYFWQQDHTNEHPDDAIQEYDYDSRYFGLGSKGRAILRNLYYQTELALEGGRSFGMDATSDPDRIRSLAYDLTLTYNFQSKYKPAAEFEYLYATGDDDRTGSPTDTLGGNTPGTVDHGFNGFGFRNTGLALAAPISNLNMFRLGGSAKPLPDCRPLADLLVGSDVFFFMKDEGRAAGSDSTATEVDHNLGQEVDVYINWRVTSDLLWTVRYGVFFPGDAYEGSRAARNFLFTGLTFSF